jgi:hypothetical protein
MRDEELFEKLRKIKPKQIDTAPYDKRIRQKIEMRFQRAKKRRSIFKKLSFALSILIALSFIIMPFLYGKSEKISLLRGGDIVPHTVNTKISFDKKTRQAGLHITPHTVNTKRTVKIINNVQYPFAYDKDTETIWFIGKKNNLYTVFYMKLSDKKANALSPAVENPTNVKGDIKILDDKIYAGINNYLYIIDKKTHEVSVMQLGKERYATKNAPHPIQAILPLASTKIIVSRANACGIIFYDPVSSKSNEYKLPLNVESPFEMLVKDSNGVYFVTHFTDVEEVISGILNPRNRHIVLFDNIPVTHIFYADGLFAESCNTLLQIDIKNKVFHKVDIKAGNDVRYIQGENAIYIISDIGICKYVPKTNTLYGLKDVSTKYKEVLGVIEKDSALFLVTPDKR